MLTVLLTSPLGGSARSAETFRSCGVEAERGAAASIPEVTIRGTTGNRWSPKARAGGSKPSSADSRARAEKSSKLMAAKRPDLFPVFDLYVGQSLYDTKESNFWAPWVPYIGEGKGNALLTAALNARNGAAWAANVTPLRVIDIVVWMRSHGDETLRSVPLGSPA
ncbi:MAG: DUF6308 family protein [Microthrixaceae bacterium]